MSMSLNSLDSKTSPHSLHSTNSTSSSRATICTRGCLHGFIVLFLSGTDGGVGVINPGKLVPQIRERQNVRKLAVFFALSSWLSSPFSKPEFYNPSPYSK